MNRDLMLKKFFLMTFLLYIACNFESANAADPSMTCKWKSVSDYESEAEIREAISCLERSIAIATLGVKDLQETVQDVRDRLKDSVYYAREAEKYRLMYAENGDIRAKNMAIEQEKLHQVAFELYDRGRKRVRDFQDNSNEWSKTKAFLEVRLNDLRQLSMLLHKKNQLK